MKKFKIVLLAFCFLILLPSITFAGVKFYNNRNVKAKTVETKPEIKTVSNTMPEPYDCPDGMQTPTGGRISWDGTKNCIPIKPESNTNTEVTTQPKTKTNPIPTYQPSTPPVYTPPNQPVVTTPAPTPTKVCADKNLLLEALSGLHDQKLGDAEANHNRILNQIQAAQNADGMADSYFSGDATDQENQRYYNEKTSIFWWFVDEKNRIYNSC